MDKEWDKERYNAGESRTKRNWVKGEVTCEKIERGEEQLRKKGKEIKLAEGVRFY